MTTVKIPVSFLFLLLCVVGSACKAQSRLLALSKSDHTLAIIDPSTLKVLTRVPVGEDPHEVIASTDGKTAYVSIYGGGSLHALNIIDIVGMKPIKTVDTRPLFGPHGLAFAEGKVYFSAEGSKAVGSYNPATDKIDWCMGTGQDRTHMIFVSPEADKIYTTNTILGTVSIISKSASGNMDKWEQTVVPASKGAEGFDVSLKNSELWTVARDNGEIYIIDITSKKIKTTIDAKAFGADRLKFTPDGKWALISSLSSGTLFIFDTETHKEIKKINVGHGAAGILVDPNGSRAFVSCSPDNYVAVVDLKTFKVTAHIDVGKNPDGLAWAAQQ